jgi:hypothetical protein
MRAHGKTRSMGISEVWVIVNEPMSMLTNGVDTA